MDWELIKKDSSQAERITKRYPECLGKGIFWLYPELGRNGWFQTQQMEPISGMRKWAARRKYPSTLGKKTYREKRFIFRRPGTLADGVPILWTPPAKFLMIKRR